MEELLEENERYMVMVMSNSIDEIWVKIGGWHYENGIPNSERLAPQCNQQHVCFAALKDQTV